ncbi:hypothetical protein SPRG_12156 [Saprolegnia parasitica CBS 223.65]|uniref:3-hydroxyacyl-CoA dehydrogenase NAD binding domain-containing protein n=1 Tax=Saprolegnia parasitica (strain CBS 223.65) TaxID=695850 RepID=A0A067C0W2_SAPPC|nr:hypothetical protein SPRG_12156 [Saprolegnia parasitica CBS 223.65]KDO22730.1 hypothetical protein SPRG_12156 [Saprolegnia parasitica CBS 223.65]|eukprot:XP_012206519.1 hypothetical protein SPRG_12156 [Saprolegnia parasitica CBS 223.65]
MARAPLTGNSVVAVIGAGTLGRCIAFELSMSGHRVVLFDRNPDSISRDILKSASYAMLQPLWRLGYIPQDMVGRAVSNIQTATTLEEVAAARPALVIESIPDTLGLKRDLFRTLERLCPATTIYGTSTMNLNVNDIASGMARPSHLLGIRFFHPVLLIPLVELTPGAATAADVVADVQRYMTLLHKTCNFGPTKHVLDRAQVNNYQLQTAHALGYHQEALPVAVPVHSHGHH